MNKRLLILGTLGEFEQLVQKARARGIYTICLLYTSDAADE